MSVLSVRDLEVTYSTQAGPIPAVRGLSLDIDPGEVLGLAGESGCGKSTVVNAILRLLPAGTTVSGEVLLNGEDVLTMKPGRLRAVRWTGASVVFQGAMHAMNPVQRIGDQLAEAIVLHGQAGEKEALVRVGDLLEQVGMPPRRLRDYPHELSGGQKQRVMIAMALACSPSLVIADEPTTALDVMVQAQVLNLLNKLQRELGLAMLFITHDLSVLVEVSNTSLFLRAYWFGSYCYLRLYLVQTAEKGLAWMRLTAGGKPGHGSFVHDDNAVTRLCEAVARLGLPPLPDRAHPADARVPRRRRATPTASRSTRTHRRRRSPGSAASAG